MMEDKKLLEAAAKAAGMNVLTTPWPKKPDGWFWCEHSSTGPGLFKTGSFGRGWNPLQDDGDALRLAVNLRLTVAVRYNECEVFEDGGECLTSEPIFTASEFVKPEQATDPAKATRRAIVCAAAALATAPDA